MKAKKLWSVLLAAVMVVSMAACQGGTDAAVSGENEEPDRASSDEDITLTFWHVWPDGEMHDVIEEFIEKYEQEHPNITIEEVGTQEVEYQTSKLKVAAATSSQGDVFMSWGGGYAKAYVDAGICMPLDDYFEADGTTDRMLDGVMEYFTYDDKAYGIPLKQWAGVLFCNQEMFDEYGLELPRTWDDLMNAVETFRENDITPMVLGAKDGWHIGMIQNALAVRTAGPEAVNAMLSGDASLDNEDIAKSAQLLIDLKNAGAFPDGTMALSADEAQEEFYMELVPMYFGGSWASTGCDSDEYDLQGKVEVVPMPVVEGGKGDETTFSGGAIDGYMINAATEYPDEAIAFALAMAEYQSEECYKLGDSLPAWKLDVDESEVSPTLMKVNELIQDATGYVLAWDTFLEGEAIDAHYNLLQELIGGDLSAAEFASGMQEANERAKNMEEE